MKERLERRSERTSEWPSAYVPILGSSSLPSTGERKQEPRICFSTLVENGIERVPLCLAILDQNKSAPSHSEPEMRTLSYVVGGIANDSL